jgi:hypothetical protein
VPQNVPLGNTSRPTVVSTSVIVGSEKNSLAPGRGESWRQRHGNGWRQRDGIFSPRAGLTGGNGCILLSKNAY